MRRVFATLALVPTLVFMLAAPAAAKAPAWTYSHWVPEAFGPSAVCGVPFDLMTPSGYVDFWVSPDGSNQIQHWVGTMTFQVTGGSSVTMRENDWRYLTDAYYADQTGYSETSTAIGLLEELTTSASRVRLTDMGTVTTRSENTFLGGIFLEVTSMQVLHHAGVLPMRSSGFSLPLQGWNKECTFFQAYLH